MADSKSTVELVFQGIDRTGEATKAALGNAEQFSRSLQNVTAPVADFTAGALKLEAALLAGGAAIAAFAVKAAGDFDTAFSEISTLIDAPTEDLEKFRKALLDYAQTSTQSLPDVTSAVYSAISAGVDYTDSLDAIAVAEQLAVAGKANLDDSLVVLASSLNAFGAGMDEAESFADSLFTTVRLGQTTLPELSGSLSQVTSIAANAGVDFDELLAAIAALTAQGQPTAQAITSIRGALSNIIKPTSEAASLAADLGIEFNATALETKGFQGVLQDVTEATGGNVDQIAKLFGSVQGLTGVLALGGEGAEDFANNLVELENSTGAVEAAFGKMADTLDNTNNRIGNAVQGALVKIGDPLLAEYGNVADGIVAIFEAIGADVEDGQLGGLVDVIAEIMRDIGSVLNDAAVNLPEALGAADLSGFSEGIQTLADSISDLFNGLDLGTPEGLQRAIEGLGSAFKSLSEFTAGAIEAIGELIQFVADNGAERVLEFAETWAKTAGAIGGVAIALNALLPAITAFLSVVNIVIARKLAMGTAATAAGTSLGALAAKLGPAGAVAGAVGYFGFQIGKLTTALVEWKNASDRAADAEDALEQAMNRRADLISRIEAETGATLDTNRELVGQLEEQGFALDENTGKWVKTAEEVRNFDAEVNAAMQEAGIATVAQTEQVSALQQALLDAGLSAEQIGLSKPLEEAAKAAKGANEETRAWVEYIDADGNRAFTDLGSTGTKAFADVATEIEEATQTSEDFRLKLAEIDSAERVRIFELGINLDIARIEADTARIESAFESINTTIQSSGDLLGTLVGSLGSAETISQRWSIERLIDAEEARRDQALDLQKQLTEAQIQELRARAESLSRGDALITVDGAGLQPHLEAFMWEILRTIQTRVNQDGLDMLLGTS